MEGERFREDKKKKQCAFGNKKGRRWTRAAEWGDQTALPHVNIKKEEYEAVVEKVKNVRKNGTVLRLKARFIMGDTVQ